MRSLRFLPYIAVAAVAVVPLQRARAQAVSALDDVTEVRTQFLADLDTLNTKLTALANAIPADKYSWRPSPGVRSVGEVFMHLASEFYVYSPMAVGAAPSPNIKRDKGWAERFEKNATKEEVLKELAASHDYAKSAIGSVDPSSLTGKRKLFGGEYNVIETTLGMTDDMHEHLGQLIAYARMNGVVPPWSRKTA